jgi:hypothetical protein
MLGLGIVAWQVWKFPAFSSLLIGLTLAMMAIGLEEYVACGRDRRRKRV